MTLPAESALPSVRARLIAIAFLYWLALYLYVPTLPIYIQTKTSNLALVGTVLSMYGLWQLFSRMPVGIASDWLGRRKPFIVAGLVLVAAGAFILGRAPGVQALIAGRALVGFAAATWVPLLVLYSSLFHGKELVRATAFLTAVGTFGRIVGTGLTASLNTLGGFPLAFYVATAAALLAAAITLTLPEQRQSATQTLSAHNILALFRNREVIVPALMNALIHYAEYATTFSFTPILARNLGATDGTLSLLVSFGITVFLVGNLCATYLIRRWGLKPLLTLAAVLLSAGLVNAALASVLPAVFLTQFLVSLSVGTGYPIFMSLSVKNVDPSERTSAMGLHQSVYSAGMFGGPWLSGILASQVGMPAMFAGTAALTLVLSLAGIASLRNTLQDG
jgi:MFS family permease